MSVYEIFIPQGRCLYRIGSFLRRKSPGCCRIAAAPDEGKSGGSDTDHGGRETGL